MRECTSDIFVENSTAMRYSSVFLYVTRLCLGLLLLCCHAVQTNLGDQTNVGGLSAVVGAPSKALDFLESRVSHYLSNAVSPVMRNVAP